MKVAAKNKNAKFLACELWVKRVGTFGVVLYRKQWPVNFILHFAELSIGSFIRYKNTLFKKILLQCYIAKRNLISYNCFSEYILDLPVQHFYKVIFSHIVSKLVESNTVKIN